MMVHTLVEKKLIRNLPSPPNAAVDLTIKGELMIYVFNIFIYQKITKEDIILS